MIAYTPFGLLYTAADYDSIEELISKPRSRLQVWFCPIGHMNPEWVENRTKVRLLLNTHVWDGFISDWNPVLQGPLVLPKHCEEVLRRELGDRFIGPIEEVPSPCVNRRESMNTWFTYVMHELTRDGDYDESTEYEYEDEDTCLLGASTLVIEGKEIEPKGWIDPSNSQLSTAGDQAVIKFPRSSS